MYKPNYKSKCCKAKVRVVNENIVKNPFKNVFVLGVKNYERKLNKTGQTFYYICQKCHKPCDILEASIIKNI